MGFTRFQSEWKGDSPDDKGSGKREGVTKCYKKGSGGHEVIRKKWGSQGAKGRRRGPLGTKRRRGVTTAKRRDWGRSQCAKGRRGVTKC